MLSSGLHGSAYAVTRRASPPFGLRSRSDRTLPICSLDKWLAFEEEPTVKHSSRRNVLGLGLGLVTIQSLPALAKPPSGDWSSPGLAVPIDPSAPRFTKTKSGIKIQELALGNGAAAAPGARVVIDYVLRRNNGYFIYSTVEGVSFQPRSVPIGPVELVLGKEGNVKGLEEVIRGMRVGGQRRALIPPALGYGAGENLQPQPPTFANQRQVLNHQNEPMLFEVQLLKIRN